MNSSELPVSDALPKVKRIRSVDIVRGMVMVLMAIDHVRVYSGVSAGSLETGAFFTRWITHFCAPAFAFLAGTSIFFMERKIGDRGKLSRQLLLRGFILILLELTILHFFWTFNVNFTNFVLAGVIWMLGCCMIIMVAFIRLKPIIAGIIGVSIILFQQAFSYVPDLFSEGDLFLNFWKFIYPTGFENPRADTVVVLYVIVPWIGVMASGYAFGLLFQMSEERRRKLCIWSGIVLTTLFLVIGSVQILMNPSETSAPPFILQLLAQQKYPASPLFLLMTLGPVILLIPFAEKMKGWLSNALNIIGRVPLFYYLVHILLIHISALMVQWISDGSIHNEWFDYAPFAFVPETHKWSLITLYAVFFVDVVILYKLCRWYAAFKSSRPDMTWLKYL